RLLYFRYRSADDVRTMSNVAGNERKRASSVKEMPSVEVVAPRRASCSDVPTGGERIWEQIMRKFYQRDNEHQETLCVPDGVTIGA
ncbi:hypothetical protein PFISCL1PPCAC_22375, partial [Pristionchus fissidentatus]